MGVVLFNLSKVDFSVARGDRVAQLVLERIFTPEITGMFWLFAKIFLFFFVFSWVKATVPRYRYDQLMRLGWKVFLPLSLVFVIVISGYLMIDRVGL